MVSGLSLAAIRTARPSGAVARGLDDSDRHLPLKIRPAGEGGTKHGRDTHAARPSVVGLPDDGRRPPGRAEGMHRQSRVGTIARSRQELT